METEGSMRIHKGSPVIPILNRINPIPRTDTNFFKIHSNIVQRLGLPKVLFPEGVTIHWSTVLARLLDALNELSLFEVE